jgi:hypothetical protein
MIVALQHLLLKIQGLVARASLEGLPLSENRTEQSRAVQRYLIHMMYNTMYSMVGWWSFVRYRLLFASLWQPVSFLSCDSRVPVIFYHLCMSRTCTLYTCGGTRYKTPKPKGYKPQELQYSTSTWYGRRSSYLGMFWFLIDCLQSTAQ